MYTAKRNPLVIHILDGKHVLYVQGGAAIGAACTSLMDFAFKVNLRIIWVNRFTTNPTFLSVGPTE